MKRIWCYVFAVLAISLIFASPALAANTPPYHLKLLAVQEQNETYVGSDADLYLELKEGSGRVFLETFPLTKMDTQVSTRFAKEIACSHFRLDCDKYDFIYTIKAKSSIVGGPSAGAATAALTTIAVLDLKHDEAVTVTGTINSGAIVGPVGGVKEKLEAASKIGLKKVLVAKGGAKMSGAVGIVAGEDSGIGNTTDGSAANDANNSTASKPSADILQSDLIKFARDNLSLEAVEVIDLDEVIFHLSGVSLNRKNITVEESPEYRRIMDGLRSLLCSRTDELDNELRSYGKPNKTIMEKVGEKRKYADNATLNGDYYSAASYCFGANILLKTEYYRGANPLELRNSFFVLERKVNALEQKLNEESIETISDLQTLIIIKERLQDVREQIEKYKSSGGSSKEVDAAALLAYSEERYYSALSWMQFFSMGGKKLVFGAEELKASCMEKMSEAQEREQYASIFIGDFNTQGIKEEIQKANDALAKEDFELCLIQSIQAKGEANAVLSSLGLSEESFNDFFESKSRAVQRVIAENTAEGKFPILGYSYYQYANSLKEQEKINALIYLEYALELSDLGNYFPEEKKAAEAAKEIFLSSSKKLADEYLGKLLVKEEWIPPAEGFLAGVVLTLLAMFLFRKMHGRKPNVQCVRR
ncbi:MAG: S16 family serine protease [Nanoarchaeota archaeon]